MSKILGYISKTGHGTHFRETITPELEALTWGDRKVWTPVQAALERQTTPVPLVEGGYAELVARMRGRADFIRDQGGIKSAELMEQGADAITFLAAPPVAPAVPLTDSELAKIALEDEFLLYCDQDSFNEIARAIEAAHGITGASK